MRGRGDARRVGDRAQGVRGQREGHDARAVAEQRLDVGRVERPIGPDRRLAHHEPVVLGDPDPRRDVGVVVELGDDDLVAAAQRARHGVREQEVERRHVRPERDLLGRAARQVGGRRARRGDQLGRLARGRERAAVVGRPAREMGAHGLDDHVGHLRAARPVEVGDRPRQRREAAADGVDVERHQSLQSGAHGTST
jgi:hypothetical protein